jgi:hypothetical protein
MVLGLRAMYSIVVRIYNESLVLRGLELRLVALLEA